MKLRDLLEDLKPHVNRTAVLYPSPEAYRLELLFFAQPLF